jgi:peptide/nickel transport system permease protein
VTAVPDFSQVSARQDGASRRSWAALRRLPPTGYVGAVILLGYIAVAVLAPVLAPYGPTDIFVSAPFDPPSPDFWLGTDNLGRDVLSRVIFGSRTVLLMAGSAAATATILGGLIGMTLGYRGGWLDEIAMRLLEIVMSIPATIFALLIIGTLGPGAVLVTATVGLLYVPNVARVVRAATQAVAGEDFIAAARARGEGSLSIVLRELLPNVVGTLVVEFSIRTGYAILFIGGLGFLGFGAQPPTPDWGLMVNEGRGTIDASAWPVIAPAVGMAVLVTAVNLFSDAILRLLGPAEQGRSA